MTNRNEEVCKCGHARSDHATFPGACYECEETRVCADVCKAFNCARSETCAREDCTCLRTNGESQEVVHG